MPPSFVQKQDHYDIGSLGKLGVVSLRMSRGSGGQIQTVIFGNPSFQRDHREYTQVGSASSLQTKQSDNMEVRMTHLK